MPTIKLRRHDGSEYQHPVRWPDFYDVFLSATDEPQAVGDLIVSRLRVTHPEGGGEVTLSDDHRAETLAKLYGQLYTEYEEVADEYINGKSFDEFQERLAAWYQQIPDESRSTAEVNLDYDRDYDRSTFCLSYRRRRTTQEQAQQDELARQDAERTEVRERSELNRLLKKYPGGPGDEENEADNRSLRARQRVWFGT